VSTHLKSKHFTPLTALWILFIDIIPNEDVPINSYDKTTVLQTIYE